MLDSVQRKKRWLESVVDEVEELIGHRPSEEELADSLEMSVEDLRLLAGNVSTGEPVGMAGSPDCGWQVEEQPVQIDPAVAEVRPITSVPVISSATDLSEAIRDLARQLPPLHQKVLTLYYFDNLRLPEIAQVCGQPEPLIALIQADCILVIQRALREFAERNDR